MSFARTLKTKLDSRRCVGLNNVPHMWVWDINSQQPSCFQMTCMRAHKKEQEEIYPSLVVDKLSTQSFSKSSKRRHLPISLMVRNG